jgi:membrane protein DedA with SNARE-associated domain
MDALTVFLLTLLEQVVAFIPSAAVPTLAGFMLLPDIPILQAFSTILFAIVLPASVAAIIGSGFVYGIGYWFGKPAIDRFGKWFDLSWKQVHVLRKWFERGRDELLIFLSRAIPIIPLSPISFGLGLMRYDFKAFLTFTFPGCFVRFLLYSLLGWQARLLVAHLNLLELLLIALCLVSICVYLFKKKISAWV